jgi:spoIIIJ-associated protein
VTRTVEATGTTVEAAVASALAKLGVSEHEAEVEVLVQPKRGFFGGGRPARVRAALLPSADSGSTDIPDSDAPTQEDGVTEPTMHEEEAVDAAEQGASSGSDSTTTAEQPELSPEERMELLDQEAEIAADFLEGLLDLLDLPGDLEIQVREEQAIVNIAEVGSGLLIGRRGATLDALQELVRCATQRRTERRSHVRVDVEGYRERQLDKLRDKCRDAIAQVRETQESVRLEPMDPYERKMMHDLVAKSSGVVSSSEGSEPRRRVVIEPEG